MKDIKQVESQIYEKRKTVRYDIRDLTVEVICSKYDDSLDDTSENSEPSVFNYIYVPEYQRDFTWDKKRQSKLIESLILGLPIPFIFVAENKDSSWEIVDGSQRIRTLHAFVNNNLELIGLKTLDKLNRFKFNNLDTSRKGKILNTALRLIVLSEETTDGVKKDMFERINRGSDLLKPMEKRKGIYQGRFISFIYDFCKSNKDFRELAPIDGWLKKRQEREELLLRFFALSDGNAYTKGLPSGIANFLDSYLEKKNAEFDQLSGPDIEKELKKYEDRILKVIDFVDKNFPYGFSATDHRNTKRSVFEAIALGTYVFLESKNEKKEGLDKNYIIEKLADKEFRKFAYVANELHKKHKLSGRVNFIYNMLKK